MSSKVRNSAAALVGILLLLMLSDVSFSESIRVLAVCTLQVFSGAFFVSKVWYRRGLKIEEFIGLGFAVGTTFSVVSEQVFLKSAISSIGWAIPCIVAGVWYFFAKKRFTSEIFDECVESPNNLVWLAIGVLAVLGPEWYWPAIPALLLAVAQLLTFNQDSRGFAFRLKKQLVGALRLLAVAMLGIGVYIRPSSWWIEDSDFGFFEALTVSFSNWGITGNSLAVGSSIKYHWFVYAWMGGVTKAAHLPSWVMLSRAGIVIGVVAVVSLAWTAISYFCRSYMARVIALFLFCFFDSYPSWGSGFRIGLISSPSQLVGFAWLLAILVLVIEQQKQRVKYSPLLFSVLFAGAMLSKISHGVVGLSGLLFLFAIEIISKKKITTHRVLDIAASFVTVVGLFYAFYFGANNATLSPLKFPAAIQGELSSYSGTFVFVATIFLILGLTNFQLVSVAGGLLDRSIRKQSVFLFCVGSGVSGVLLSLIIDVYMGAQLYFLHSATIIILIFAVCFTAESVISIFQKYRVTKILLLLVAIGIISSVLAWLIPSLNSGSRIAILLRLSKSMVLLVPVALALLLAKFQKNLKKLPAAIGFVSLSLASLGIGFYGSNWFAVLNREFASFDRNQQSNLGSQELNDAMKWLKTESDQDDIFASNNDSFLLSALSQRRGFLQSKYLMRRHTVFATAWEGELDSRGELLTETFSEPTESKLRQLEDRGVRWLVVKKIGTAYQNLSKIIGSSSFENDQYLILDLRLLA
jgi:hypothetical protein